MDAQLNRFLRGIILATGLQNILVYILAKNVAVYCLCPKNLLEAKLKCFGLTSLAEEISRKPSIDCVSWLL